MNELLNESLSGADIQKALNGNCKMVTYDELMDYDSLEDLMSGCDNLIILYLTSDNYGHWTGLFKNGNGNLEMFDSYGTFVDDQMKYIPKEFKKKIKMRPALAKMMYDYNRGDIEYNNWKLQSDNPNVATCGKWVVLRILFKDLDIDKFKDLFKKGIDNPDLFCAIVFELIRDGKI